MNKIGIFSLIAVITIAITGAATISSFIVSADAQPAGTQYCIQPVGPSPIIAVPLPSCFPTEAQCQAVIATLQGDGICIPQPPRGR